MRRPLSGPMMAHVRAVLFAAVLATLTAAPVFAVQARAVDAATGRSDQDRPAAALGFVVVVNEASTQTAISLDLLSKIFLKKVQRWSTGGEVTPVDQQAASALRERFTKSVHRRSVTAVNAYWQQQIFSGHELPPAELAGNAAVIAFVRSHPEAIAYVAAGTPLPAGVKALRVES